MSEKEPLMDIRWIMSVIPHRYPLLLIDRVLEIEPKKRIVAIKNVTVNEEFFAGHFPGHPVMPGVLVIEAMAQAGGLLLMHDVADRENKLIYLHHHQQGEISAARGAWRSAEDRDRYSSPARGLLQAVRAGTGRRGTRG